MNNGISLPYTEEKEGYVIYIYELSSEIAYGSDRVVDRFVQIMQKAQRKIDVCVDNTRPLLAIVFLMIFLEFKYIGIFFYTLSNFSQASQIYLTLLLRNERQNEICSSNVCSATISVKYRNHRKRTYRISLQ